MFNTSKKNSHEHNELISFSKLILNSLRGNDLLEVVKKFINQSMIKEFRILINQLSLLQTTKVFELLEEEHQIKFIRLMTTSQAAEFFVELEVDVQAKLIQSFQSDLAHEIIEQMKSDELSDLIEELPENLAQNILLIN